MKILYVVSSLQANDGVATFLVNYLTHMDISEHQVMIACSTKNISNKTKEKLNNLNINIYDVSHPSEIGIRNYVKNVVNFFKRHNNFDIIHCNTISTSFIFLYLAKKHNIKIRILHSHSTKNSESKLNNIRKFFISKICLHYANSYVACSKLAGDYLFGKKKYHIISNAIDYNAF